MCNSELTFVNLDTEVIITLRDGDLITSVNNITFKITTTELRINRRYNVTVRASNSAGSTTSYVTISECSYII